MSKDHKFDFGMHRVVYGDEGSLGWLDKMTEKEKAEILHNIKCNRFEQILHFFYTNGMQLEDMARILAAKAERHTGWGERKLGVEMKKVLTSVKF